MPEKRSIWWFESKASAIVSLLAIVGMIVTFIWNQYRSVQREKVQEAKLDVVIDILSIKAETDAETIELFKKLYNAERGGKND